MAEDTWGAMMQKVLDINREKPKTGVSEGTWKNKM